MKGKIVVDAVTKRLLKRINSPSIAILNHPDIDELAAYQLSGKKPLAIINFSPTMSGRFPSKGGKILLEAGIPLFDVKRERAFFHLLKDGMNITLPDETRMSIDDLGITIALRKLTLQDMHNTWDEAIRNYDQTFCSFAKNTLYYANKELDDFIKPFPTLPLDVSIQGKPVVVVARRPKAQEELRLFLKLAHHINPIYIGVDGGSDILLQEGIDADIIVGDMDSVSSRALKRSKELVLHAYRDGLCPGERRMREEGFPYHLLPFQGTSEDVAILLAYHQGASSIYLIGSHTNMLDFLEKGRSGMGSTILTRMKVGHLLHDLRGLYQLFGLSDHEPSSSRLNLKSHSIRKDLPIPDEAAYFDHYSGL